MYSGLVLLLVLTIFCNQPLLVRFRLLVVLWYLTRFQIVPEERVLAEKFGDFYLKYRQTVRRRI